MKKYVHLLFILLYTVTITAQEETEKKISQRYSLSGVTIEGKRKIKFKKDDKIVLDDLNFKGGTADLLPGSEPILEKLLKIMQDNPKLKIQVQGHICCITDISSEVSEARARIVWLYLLLNEIENERVSYKDFGGSRPIYTIPERNEGERRQNRRVEILVVGN